VSLKVVDAMREHGLFWTLVPKSLGGFEDSVLTHIEVVEEIARSHGSTGWTLMANCAATTIASHYCSDEHVARMFGGKRRPVLATTYAPNGKAVLTGNTYRGGGRYSFGSGIAHADWVSGALVVQENGAPVKDENGMLKVRGAYLPKESIRVLGNWNVVGLRGTGSFDYEIPEQDIPQDWTINQYWTEPQRSSVVTQLGALPTVVAGHVGVALGLARRSLEDAAKIATASRRFRAPGNIASSPVFRFEFAKHDALFRAARALAMQVWGEAEDTVKSGKPLSEEQVLQMRQAGTWIHEVAKDVVNYCYGSVSGSLRTPSVLGDCVVDIAVANQHVIVDQSTLVDAAPSLIDSWATAEMTV
jgi:alkylation response protein AidB-like acyl-CoA dehydrogenase